MLAHTFRAIGLTAVASATLLTVPPAIAQDSGEEARLRKIEAEVRALQRRVFPGGDGRYFEPEITAPAETARTPIGGPSTTAVTDILTRLDAMESQLQRLTAQNEENANGLRLLADRVEELEATRSAAQPSGTLPVASGTPNATPAPTPTPAASPSPARIAAVQAIMKPQTDDAADDEYTYGFRLWEAGFYPEAQQQLTLFVEQNPDHWRATYGRNLLGRAYLDDDKPRDAAPWFLRNYQADKNAARAGDSLLYLAETMIAIDDTKRACIALAEFGETYPALAAGRLQTQYDANRAKVSCS